MKDFHIRISDAAKDAIERQAIKERRGGARVVEEAVALYVVLWSKAEQGKGTARLQSVVDKSVALIERA